MTVGACGVDPVSWTPDPFRGKRSSRCPRVVLHTRLRSGGSCDLLLILWWGLGAAPPDPTECLPVPARERPFSRARDARSRTPVRCALDAYVTGLGDLR